MKRFITTFFIFFLIILNQKSRSCMYCTGAKVLYNVGIEIHEYKFKFINIRWLFDEKFSGRLFWKYDRNGNKKFEKKEKYYLRKYAFANLKRFNYFLNINFRGRNIKGFKVTNFKTSIHKNKIAYTFKIPVNVMLKRKVRLKIKLSSPDSFMAFLPNNANTNKIDISGKKIGVKTFINKNSAEYLIFHKSGH